MNDITNKIDWMMIERTPYYNLFIISACAKQGPNIHDKGRIRGYGDKYAEFEMLDGTVIACHRRKIDDPSGVLI